MGSLIKFILNPIRIKFLDMWLYLQHWRQLNFTDNLCNTEITPCSGNKFSSTVGSDTIIIKLNTFDGVNATIFT